LRIFSSCASTSTSPETRLGQPSGPPPHDADDLRAEFVPYFLRIGKDIRPVRIAHHLQQPRAIAQVDENDAAVVATSVHPAEQGDGLADELRVHQARIFGTHQKLRLSCAARAADWISWGFSVAPGSARHGGPNGRQPTDFGGWLAADRRTRNAAGLGLRTGSGTVNRMSSSWAEA
jgi:hypothetical protein